MMSSHRTRNVIEPHGTHIVSADIASIVPSLAVPKGEIVVLSPERTFWEKATLIHSECHRETSKEDANRMARHWYDIAMLAENDIGRSALRDRDLLSNVVAHKNCFYYAGFSNYEACLNGNMQLSPGACLRDQLETDFHSMISHGIFYQAPPTFNDVMEKVSSVEKEINGSQP